MKVECIACNTLWTMYKVMCLNFFKLTFRGLFSVPPLRWLQVSLTINFTAGFVVAEMLSFLRRTLGRRSMRKHAERERLREAQRAATHIPAAGDAKSIITCRVSLLDGTDVSVDLPVSRALLAACCVWDHCGPCFLGVRQDRLSMDHAPSYSCTRTCRQEDLKLVAAVRNIER